MFIVFISFRCQFGAPEVFFPWAPACAWNYMAPLSSCWLTLICFFLSPSFFHFFFLFPFFSSNLFHSFSLSVSFLSFFLSFWSPFGDPGGPGPPKPRKIRPCFYVLFIHPSPYASYFFFVLSSRKFQPILQKVESRGRCCLLTFLLYFFDFLLVKHPPMQCRLILCVSKTFWFLMPLLCRTQTIFTYSSYVRVGRGAANTEWRHIQRAPNRQRKGKTNI